MRINIARFLCITFLLVFYSSCSSTIPRIASGLGTTLEIKKSKEYCITDICVDTLKNDSARIFCRVQKEGKGLRGYLDVAVVSPSGTVVFQGSINSYMQSRIGGYTISAIGFPFEFKMPLEILRNNSLHLAFHKNVYEGEKFFNSGSRNLAL